LNVQQLLPLLLWNDFHFEMIFQKETKLNWFGNLWLLLLLPPKGWALNNIDRMTRSASFVVGLMFLHACTF